MTNTDNDLNKLIEIAMSKGMVKTLNGGIRFDSVVQLQATIDAVNSTAEHAFWNCNDIDLTNCRRGAMLQFCKDNMLLAPFFVTLAHEIESPPNATPQSQALKANEQEVTGQVNDALVWYQEKATSIHRYIVGKPTQDKALLAVITELSLDNGTRAASALINTKEE